LQRDRDEDGTLHRGRRGSSRAHHQHHHPYQLPADAGISDPNDDAGLTLGPGEPWRLQLPRAAPWAGVYGRYWTLEGEGTRDGEQREGEGG
jgi:hypothetical protein